MSTDVAHPAAEAKCTSRRYVAASIGAGLLNFFVIPLFLFPKGAKSHYTLEGTILAVAAGLIGCCGFFGCPRRPVLVKLGTGVVCVFSAAIAMFAVIQFIRFGQSE